MARAKLLLREIETYAQNIGDTIRDPLLILDRDQRVKSANRAFYHVFQTTPEETESCLLAELGNGQWNIPELLTLLHEIVPHKTHFDDFEVTHRFPHLGRRTMLLNARKLYRPGNRTVLLALAIEDVTERKTREAERAAAAERDKQIATALQCALLFMPLEDSFPGMTVKSVYEPASDEALVGGDFSDAFAFDDGQIALVLGDVMGKGLDAAVFTAELKFTLRAFVQEHEEPARIVSRMNTYLCEKQRLQLEGLNGGDEVAPVCLTLAVIHAASGVGTVVSAGMESLLLVRADGATEEVAAHNLVLGVDPHADYAAVSFQLQPADFVVLSTDGITEARHGDTLLGFTGLTRLAQKHQSRPTLTETAQSMLDGARTFARGKLHDDACLLLARRI